jgi:hypothetical protein
MTQLRRGGGRLIVGLLRSLTILRYFSATSICVHFRLGQGLGEQDVHASSSFFAGLERGRFTSSRQLANHS